MITIKKTKSLKAISREWDLIASLREKQINSGIDHSANFVLSPAILNEMPKSLEVIDIGCGTGWLTSRAAKISKKIVGIDPSRNSINIAKLDHFGENISFSAMSVEEHAASGKKYDAAISNMAASSTPELEKFIKSSRKLLKKNGVYILTIPHPCFWPIYWGYASDPEFSYEKTFAVEGNFKIQNEVSDLITTHFHHPLEHYLNLLSGPSFRLESIRELKGNGFLLPRFILIKSRAV